jgi:O-antigen/teichoic acid export membrane protein
VTARGLRSLPFGAVGGPTAGYVAVGVSGFALLASGPRLLGHDEFSLLAIAWTIATIVGVGIGQPGEQTVTRVTAGAGESPVATGVQRRLGAVAALTLLLPVAAWLGHAPLLGGSVLWSSSVVVFAVGWAVLAGPRGRLAAASDFAGYSGTLAAEATTRVGLCALAWLVPSAASALLAAAVGVPMLVSALVARRRLPATVGGPAAATVRAHASEQSFITAVALLSQVAINSAPLWLQARATDAALAGQLVSATSYLRIPIFLIGGLGTVALSAVSGAHGSRDLVRARRIALRSAGTAAALGIVGTAVLLLVSGPALHVLYGTAIDLGEGTLLVIAAGTVLAMTAGIVTLVCLGCDRSAATTAVWLTAAGVVTLALALQGGTVLGVVVVTALGQAVALLGLGVVAARALGRPDRAPSETSGPVP